MEYKGIKKEKIDKDININHGKRKSTNLEHTANNKRSKTDKQHQHTAQKEEQVLLIRNLPFAKAQIDEVSHGLKEKFGAQEISIARKPNGNCKGYALVHFKDAVSALAAKNKYNGEDICGRKVFIDFADKNSVSKPVLHIFESLNGADQKLTLNSIIKREVESDAEDEAKSETRLQNKVKGESKTKGEVKVEDIGKGQGESGVKIKQEIEEMDVAKSTRKQVDGKIKVKQEVVDPRQDKKRKQLERRRMKHVRLQMNKELEVCVKKRDVKFAEKLFEQFAVKGVTPDAYTYTHMINICARYGNVDRAQFYFDDMHAKGVKANVVTYTSYIKGLVMWGRMDDAVEVLQAMKEHKVAPNSRTYNTLLRGCLKDGNVDLAVELFTAAKCQQSSEALDSTCYAYVMLCNCYALHTKEAWEITEEFNPEVSTPAIAKAYASLAVAECVCGGLSQAKSALQKAEACLERITVVHATKEEASDKASGQEAIIKTEPEEAAEESENSESEVPSVAKNKKGKRPENEEYLNSPIGGNYSGKGRSKDKSEGSSYELFTLAQKEEIVAMCTAVKQFLDKEKAPPFRNIKSMEESNKMAILPPKNEVFPVKLRYGSIFNTMTASNNRPREIKMEICSGLGDWIVYQAKRSPNINWIAAEIRHERVFQIWSKGVLHELDNLYAVEADARVLISKYIPLDSLREVFINFPEPPSNENKDMHLLTVEFLKQINGILQRHGKLVVVTDNFHLAHKLEEDLKSLSKIFKSTSGGHPFSTQIPINYGSSYFDKFWTQGQRHNRYYFEYKKIW